MTKPMEARAAGGVRSHRGWLVTAVVVVVAVAVPSVGSAETTTSDPSTTGPVITSFQGSAAAVGFRMAVTVPGAPATDNPIDGGGPTAQVALDSIDASTGYAAFPDPGDLALTGPGLLVGLLGSGAAGLPPVNLGASPPNYPFFVTSDANKPEQSIGAGPYRLEAKSGRTASTASATVGFQPDVVGNVAVSTTNASVVASGVEVVSQATSDTQALTVGPISFGQVRSRATMTLDSSGKATPASSLEIVGMRIGSIPIELTPNGFVAGNSSQAFPLNASLAQLLGPAKMKVEVVAAQQFPDRVVAPALRITMPFDFALSKGTTVMTVTIGSATAMLSGASTQGSALPEIGAPAGASPSDEAAVPASLPTVAQAMGPSIDDTPMDGASPGDSLVQWPPQSDEAAPAPSLPPPPSKPAYAAPMARASAGVQLFDIGWSYLAVVVGAFMACAIGVLSYILGRRRIWASLGG